VARAGWWQDGRVNTDVGQLAVVPALTRPDLLAPAVARALAALGSAPGAGGMDAAGAGAAEVGAAEVGVAEIDPALADTAAFCERYGVSPAESANCVVIAGRREGLTRYAACVVLATTRADVNGVARRELDVRKASFAPVADAVAATGMEYGGITPIGLPIDWPVLVDAQVAATPRVVVGSGVRRSKLTLPGSLLARWPGAVVIENLAR
jgi:prolyl-tRNA editing enzyme YbaK/EbsC (Cys-tRNA(Pro) deacylase)